MKAVKSQLEARHVPVYIVDANSGHQHPRTTNEAPIKKIDWCSKKASYLQKIGRWPTPEALLIRLLYLSHAWASSEITRSYWIRLEKSLQIAGGSCSSLPWLHLVTRLGLQCWPCSLGLTPCKDWSRLSSFGLMMFDGSPCVGGSHARPGCLRGYVCNTRRMGFSMFQRKTLNMKHWAHFSVDVPVLIPIVQFAAPVADNFGRKQFCNGHTS